MNLAPSLKTNRPETSRLESTYQLMEDCRRGDVGAIAASFADNAVWRVPGNLCYSGVHCGTNEIRANAVRYNAAWLPNSRRNFVLDVLMQGNQVCIELLASGETSKGHYSNLHLVVVGIENGKVLSLRAYFDTQYAAKYLPEREPMLDIPLDRQLSSTRQAADFRHGRPCTFPLDRFCAELQSGATSSLSRYLTSNVTCHLPGQPPNSGVLMGRDAVWRSGIAPWQASVNSTHPRCRVFNVVQEENMAVIEITPEPRQARSKFGDSMALVLTLNTGQVSHLRWYFDTQRANTRG